jgi:small basic protein
MRDTTDKIMESGMLILPGFIFGLIAILLLIFGWQSGIIWMLAIIFGFSSCYFFKKAVQSWRMNL